MEHFPQSTPRPNRLPSPPSAAEFEVISDIHEAREQVADLIAGGTYPLITVPTEYAAGVREDGIHFVGKEDGLTGKRFSFVAGTIGVPPLAPSEEERYLFAVDPTVKVEPRLTGKDNAFHGVVQFPNGIPAAALTVIGKYVHGVFVPAEQTEEKETPPH